MKTNYKWIFTVFLLSFLLAMFFTFIAETVISNVSLIIGILITLIIVFIGIICDEGKCFLSQMIINILFSDSLFNNCVEILAE